MLVGEQAMHGALARGDEDTGRKRRRRREEFFTGMWGPYGMGENNCELTTVFSEATIFFLRLHSTTQMLTTHAHSPL